MPVKVLVADDSEIMRRAIKFLLRDREDITVVGEAATFPEALQKTTELRPDVLVLDLHLPDNYREPSEVQSLLAGSKILAITLGNDDVAKALADYIGAAKLLDKMNLMHELIPAILQLAAGGTSPH